MALEVLSETIYTSLANGSKDFLAYLRAFATAQGWTEEYWDTTHGQTGGDCALQLYSPGYIDQGMRYRFYTYDSDGLNYAALPASAVGSESLLDLCDPDEDEQTFMEVCWGPPNWQSGRISMPYSATIASVHFYGNKRFVAAVVQPVDWSSTYPFQSCYTICFGTFNLFHEWLYHDGLNFSLYPSDDVDNLYNEIHSHLGDWWHPMAFSGSPYYNTIALHPDSIGNYSYLLRNYKPASTTEIGSEIGSFNVPKGLLNFDHMGRRTLIQSIFFLKDSDTGVYYPLGESPMGWINGKDLSYGEIVEFGSNQYRCFPQVITTNRIWQAYRIV